MSNWKLINKTFLYDGTFDGLLTIVFDCYSTKTLPQRIENEQTYFDNFLDNIAIISSDYTKSEIGFLYNGKTYQIKELPIFSLPEFSEQEKMYQELWKSFFKSVTIAERTNKKCQMQFMPKKYWKDLVEIT